ncbi:MAG: uracil-DNA glycosylase family protein [Burkholderiaceae bacterium]
MTSHSDLHCTIAEIKECRQCAAHFSHAPRPVFSAGPSARLLIVGQAPGLKVQQSGIPWNDLSGQLLRTWLQLTPEQFYDERQIAIVPMGLCYPGKGRSGDLPPRPECAPLWHERLLASMPEVRLTLLIGQYAQRYYLRENAKTSLTETVAHFRDYLPRYFPLPHPSPRNRFWFTRNPWFDQDALPALRLQVKAALE